MFIIENNAFVNKNTNTRMYAPLINFYIKKKSIYDLDTLFEENLIDNLFIIKSITLADSIQDEYSQNCQVFSIELSYLSNDKNTQADILNFFVNRRISDRVIQSIASNLVHRNINNVEKIIYSMLNS